MGVVLLTIFSSSAFESAHRTGSVESHRLTEQLSLDYHRLVSFSEDIGLYGVEESLYAELFWKGVKASFQFHLISSRFDPAIICQLINTKLWSNPDLQYPVKQAALKTISASLANEALNRFSGTWFGKWRNDRVNHLWLPVRQAYVEDEVGFAVIGFQSCFTGDGIGWNYVVEWQGETMILGFVYHFNEAGSISAENPHYAFLNQGDQLIWVSDNHIYYESVCDSDDQRDTPLYTITGVQYKFGSKGFEVSEGFQAIYQSEAKKKPIFQRLGINGRNSSLKKNAFIIEDS